MRHCRRKFPPGNECSLRQESVEDSATPANTWRGKRPGPKWQVHHRGTLTQLASKNESLSERDTGISARLVPTVIYFPFLHNKLERTSLVFTAPRGRHIAPWLIRCSFLSRKSKQMSVKRTLKCNSFRQQHRSLLILHTDSNNRLFIFITMAH